MSRWAHWLSTWNRICHCSFVSNRSFLLFSNEYLILWIGGRNFLFSLYFPRFFSLFCRGWLWNSNEYHLQVHCSWEWDSVSYLWSFLYPYFCWQPEWQTFDLAWTYLGAKRSGFVSEIPPILYFFWVRWTAWTRHDWYNCRLAGILTQKNVLIILYYTNKLHNENHVSRQERSLIIPPS